MEFNSDGSLKVSKKPNYDHITIFNLIDELDFSVGKKLLINILRGETNSQIIKHELHKKIYHGSLGGYTEEEISTFIDYLMNLNFISIKKEKGLYPVLILTTKAKDELSERNLTLKVDGIKNECTKKVFPKTTITEQDEIIFKEFELFLSGFTNEQKKAITCLSKKQLCIAGAGSGKTSVLTNKIIFLVKFLGVKPEDVLAITFTRKARQEMISRLSKLMPSKQVRVETFNSFAEKEISYYSLLLYGKEKQMASSKQFIKLITSSMNELGFTTDTFLNHYFTTREKQGKDQRQLFFSFLYDFSAILDAFLLENKNILEFEKRSNLSQLSDKVTATSILQLLKLVTEKLEQQSLRTYSDQLIDILKLYENHPSTRKKYKWVLVDEYQDVNSEQVKLLNLIAIENLFVVGDPRQSIFAWRGAEPERIYDFADTTTEVIQLTKNFRSTKSIVDFTNKLIGELGFEPCTSNSEIEGSVTITKYSSEDSEAKSIAKEISLLSIPRNEIFILSRTNKGLEKIQKECDKLGIKYLIRTDEKKQLNLEPKEDEITLSTVHAIKGLEAKLVYVIQANYKNYPCKAKDHRFVEIFTAEKNYDQIQEEKRLLYVACTRAKDVLRITHTSSLTPFITKSASKQICSEIIESTKEEKNVEKQIKALKRWRYLEAQDRGISAYQIFSDKVLDNLIDLQPLNVEELEGISGLSKAKIKEFGYDIIAVMMKNG
ncbi:MAG: UvrD-helicase domain-containing protein [Candidatus Woesearchaeota archaeon]